jgi:pyruvate formate lyase activating enzyme
MESGAHRFDPTRCAYCGECALCCPTGAIRCDAKRFTPEALATLLSRDIAFYQNSGGGVTVSGGEPMLQARFVRALFALMKQKGVHTAVDTAAYAPWDAFEEVLRSPTSFSWISRPPIP